MTWPEPALYGKRESKMADGCRWLLVTGGYDWDPPAKLDGMDLLAPTVLDAIYSAVNLHKGGGAQSRVARMMGLRPTSISQAFKLKRPPTIGDEGMTALVRYLLEEGR